jgi:hypothetical protein
VIVPVDAPAVVPVDAPCADDDADGVCNTVDDWPCGAKPTAPGSSASFSGNGGNTNWTISNVNLDGTGRLAVATPGETLSLTLRYAIDDTACPSACIDQVEIGWEPGGGRSMCVYDDTVSPQNGVTATVTVNVAVPMTKKTYDLRANLGQNFQCGTGKQWWGGTPDASHTIAKLCVH